MNDTVVRNAILGTIDGGHAHMTFDEAVAGFPPEHYNTRPPNVSYTFWHLLEHIRICLDRTLTYSFGEEYRPMTWPRDYWPDPEAIATDADWTATVERIRAGISELRRIAADPDIDLTSLARHANGDQTHTLLHEIVDISIHNAYHIGELAILRQVMGLWPEGHT